MNLNRIVIVGMPRYHDATGVIWLGGLVWLAALDTHKSDPLAC
jgi:hypothetical protein